MTKSWSSAIRAARSTAAWSMSAAARPKAMFGRDGVVGQEDLLRHVADRALPGAEVLRGDRDAVDRERAAVGHEQPEHDVDGRGLAGPGAADDADGAPRRDREAHAPHRRPLGLRIGVVHVLELEPLGQAQRRDARSRTGRVGVAGGHAHEVLVQLVEGAGGEAHLAERAVDLLQGGKEADGGEGEDREDRDHAAERSVPGDQQVEDEADEPAEGDALDARSAAPRAGSWSTASTSAMRRAGPRKRSTK